MNPVHLDDEERRMVKSVLAFLEALLVRLNTGEPLPNAMLGEIVDFFREAEDAGGEASARGGVHPSVSEGVAEHETAAAPLCDMLWALESLDRGEAGAAGAFVISSRRYIQGCRGRLREDALDALTSPGTQLTVNPHRTRDGAHTPSHLALRRRFDRVIERYNRFKNTPAQDRAM